MQKNSTAQRPLRWDYYGVLFSVLCALSAGLAKDTLLTFPMAWKAPEPTEKIRYIDRDYLVNIGHAGEYFHRASIGEWNAVVDQDGELFVPWRPEPDAVQNDPEFEKWLRDHQMDNLDPQRVRVRKRDEKREHVNPIVRCFFDDKPIECNEFIDVTPRHLPTLPDDRPKRWSH